MNYILGEKETVLSSGGMLFNLHALKSFHWLLLHLNYVVKIQVCCLSRFAASPSWRMGSLDILGWVGDNVYVSQAQFKPL